MYFCLFLDGNPIGDNIVEPIEFNILYAEKLMFRNISLSFTKMTKYSIWRLYFGFLQTNSKHPHFTINLYPLPFHADILKNLSSIIPKLSEFALLDP